MRADRFDAVGRLLVDAMLLAESFVWGEAVCLLVLMVCETLRCAMPRRDVMVRNLMLRCGMMLLVGRDGVNGKARGVPHGRLTAFERHRRGRGVRDRLPEGQSSGRGEGATGPAAKCGLGDWLHPRRVLVRRRGVLELERGGAMSAEADLCVIANGESRPA